MEVRLHVVLISAVDDFKGNITLRLQWLPRQQFLVTKGLEAIMATKLIWTDCEEKSGSSAGNQTSVIQSWSFYCHGPIQFHLYWVNP
jgi:hypothetical protein